MRIFLEKAVKSPQRRELRPRIPGGWGLHPQLSALLLSYYNFVPFVSNTNFVFYLPQKEQNNYSKCSTFASSALLHLFFTSNYVTYFNISCPRAQGALPTPLVA